MKKGQRRKFQDINDFLENATDEEFSIKYKKIECENPYGVGSLWLLFERAKKKGYAPF
jgi:hypothetical protein